MTITSNDFQIDTTNKRITHVITSSTVFSVNSLYSYIQDYFDDVTELSFSVPMSAQTPTAYTLLDGWFIDEPSLKYLNGGAISTVGQNAVTYTHGIYIIYLNLTGYTNCISTDLIQPVTAGTTTGTLLAYDNTLRKWWVRAGNGNVWVGNISITGGSGSGSYVSSKTGESLFSSIFTLGSLDTSVTTNMYIEQLNPELSNNEIPQFWGVGHIDVLVKVMEASNFIDNGNVRVYAREYGTLYSHFSSDVSSGNRTPLPISTIADSNIIDTEANVSAWTDVTITFGTTSQDIGDGILRTYDVIIDCGLRTGLNQVYEYLQHEVDRTSTATINNYPGYFYRAAQSSYLRDYSAPFGSYTGGKFFGARGVWLKNVPPIDINNYQVTDSAGVTVSAPYSSAGTMTFSSNFLTGGTGYYTMYFSSTPNGVYGAANAIVVTNSLSVPIQGNIPSSNLQFSFSYTNNAQGGRTPGTDAPVTIVAFNPGYARPLALSYTITASKANDIILTSASDVAYIP